MCEDISFHYKTLCYQARAVLILQKLAARVYLCYELQICRAVVCPKGYSN